MGKCKHGALVLLGGSGAGQELEPGWASCGVRPCGVEMGGLLEKADLWKAICGASPALFPGSLPIPAQRVVRGKVVEFSFCMQKMLIFCHQRHSLRNVCVAIPLYPSSPVNHTGSPTPQRLPKQWLQKAIFPYFISETLCSLCGSAEHKQWLIICRQCLVSILLPRRDLFHSGNCYMWTS